MILPTEMFSYLARINLSYGTSVPHEHRLSSTQLFFNKFFFFFSFEQGLGKEIHFKSSSVYIVSGQHYRDKFGCQCVYVIVCV